MAHKNAKQGKHEGDILGLGTSPASATIPQASKDHGGHPQGIDVGRAKGGTMPGIDELTTGSGGATGIDMGGSGSGTQIKKDR